MGLLPREWFDVVMSGLGVSSFHRCLSATPQEQSAAEAMSASARS